MNLKYKSFLRTKYRNARKNIKNRDELQKKICRLFLKSDLYKNCTSVYLYSAAGSEVNLDTVIETALTDGKSVALPLCLDKNGNMEFYFIQSVHDLTRGMYGITEPIKEKCQKAVFDENTVCLVPGLCFDKSGGRLGYGKGYYDRFLTFFSGKSVGICFEGCTTEKLTLDTHDIKVDYLITDKKIYIFKTKEE